MPEQPHISVVIPVYNEQDDVVELARHLESVLDEPYEILFVDDGSTDSTWERLVSIHDPGRIRLIRFRRNFGKTAALSAGFSASRGGVVITMDGDRQDDPSEIPRFLRKLEEGYDLVVGWKKRRHDPWTRVLASRVFNFVVAKVSGLPLHDANCGFKAYRGETARSLKIHGEMHRFIPVLAAAMGFKVAEIEVTHHPRRHGRSKYGFSRLFKGFLDLITVTLLTRFQDRPAHGFGFGAIILATFGCILILARFWLAEPMVADVAAAAFWIGSLVLLAAGWLAEILIARDGRPAALPFYMIEEQLD